MNCKKLPEFLDGNCCDFVCSVNSGKGVRSDTAVL